MIVAAKNGTEKRMDLGIQNKTALVLAGGGGLGRAIAKALAGEGVHVAVAGLHSNSVEATASAVAAMGRKAVSLVWDLGDLSVIDGNVAKIEAELGPVDILVNITGGPPPTTAAGQDPALWSKHFQAMVLSVIATTDCVLPKMRERRWGRIITNTSSGMIAPIPNLGLSNALRMSLAGWSKTLAREVAADGITANIVAPGRIATDRLRFLDESRAKREGRTVEEIVAASEASIPAGRYGTPEEYADVVAFLASQRAAYITGSVIRVDGGMIPTV
ncbi:MAG TPA: SDR family oxidoreductase [Terracidiphilus sp.]|nr:SDR family oxidoreductase [Terracidiphilus sp.]